MTFAVWGDFGRGRGPESSRRSCSFLPGLARMLHDFKHPRAAAEQQNIFPRPGNNESFYVEPQAYFQFLSILFCEF